MELSDVISHFGECSLWSPNDIWRTDRLMNFSPVWQTTLPATITPTYTLLSETCLQIRCGDTTLVRWTFDGSPMELYLEFVVRTTETLVPQFFEKFELDPDQFVVVPMDRAPDPSAGAAAATQNGGIAAAILKLLFPKHAQHQVIIASKAYIADLVQNR